MARIFSFPLYRGCHVRSPGPLVNRTRLAAAAAAVAVAGGAAAVSGAFAGSPSAPPDEPLAAALHDALAARPVAGVTARIAFTNKLVAASGPAGGGPLLAGAKGRLWLAGDGRARLELQSDRGDAQVALDGRRLTVYDAGSNIAWVATLPAGPQGDRDHAVPTVPRIQQMLTELAGKVDLAGATGVSVAGREAYAVRITPRHGGGLLGAAELVWDAATGTPLRAAVTAAGSAEPVLELAATDISYGPVDAGALAVATPAGAKVVRIDLASSSRRSNPLGGKERRLDVTGAAAVRRALPFELSAPERLAGLPRRLIRLVDLGGTKGALVTYGEHLGAIAVLEQPAGAPGSERAGGEDSPLPLPEVSIGGTVGQELATALGTVVRFERDGVRYTVLGSVPPAAAEAAARGL